jgi:predicted nucleic-acid-binding protein
VIGLDTNVLVRYLMQDDARQAAQATRLLESLTPEAPGFVPLDTDVELVWVLSSCFDLGRSDLVQALDSLLRTKELVVERVEVVWKALRHFRVGSADFADCLIERSAAAAGCERTVTFDRAAAKHVGMALLS